MKIAVIGLGQMGTLYLGKLLDIGVPSNDILGVDIDHAKIAVAGVKYPNIAFMENVGDTRVDMAIVATNTPSHHKVLINLMERGVTQILCEKPLGINMSAVNDVRDVMVRTGSHIYTAFLMNFSPALLYVIDKMNGENLVLTEGTLTWGKNRFGDKRPTPGDLEDETVHGVGILHNLCAVNQVIHATHVVARLTYPEFASPEVQAMAHVLDASFPLRVNASTMALDVIMTDKGEVPCNLHSSFIGTQQVRRVTAVLSRSENPTHPVYSVEFNFDVKVDSKIIDKLVMTTLEGNSVERQEFSCDKLLDQSRAFVTVATGGIVDPRLTDYNKAREAVAFSEAVLRSHEQGGVKVSAYTEADIVPVRRSA